MAIFTKITFEKIPFPLLIIRSPSLSYLQRRELVRVMIEQAVYSQEQPIFRININPRLYNSFLSTYHINRNSRPMEYTVNGDNATIVRPVVLHRYANTRFGGGRNGTLSITENNHLILKAFATAWRYREMYEECGDVDKIINSEHVTPRFVYKHLALAYLNPKIINNLLSGKCTMPVRDILDKASSSKDLYEQESLFN